MRTVSAIFKPVIISGRSVARIAALRKKAIRVVDQYDDQLQELFAVRNPALRRDPVALAQESKKHIAALAARAPLASQGSWVYFPWSRMLVHILSRDEFYELRTARNRNLISSEEQSVLRSAAIGAAGMSVGSSIVSALVIEGAECLRIADFDTLSLSNLNRIRAGVHHLGMNKVDIAAQTLYELHPYLDLSAFPHGLTGGSLRDFVAGPPRLAVLVDEMDDLLMKIQLRQVARKLRIPVVSAADNGDGAIVDVERFDLEPKRPLFHGAIPEFTAAQIRRLSFTERIDLINRMIGFDLVVPRMKSSLAEVGKSLYSWPQLGGAAMASGAAVAFLVTHILRGGAEGRAVRSGKYDMKFEKIF